MEDSVTMYVNKNFLQHKSAEYRMKTVKGWKKREKAVKNAFVKTKTLVGQSVGKCGVRN